MWIVDEWSLSRRDFVAFCGTAVANPVSMMSPGAKVVEVEVAGGADDFMIVRHVKIEGSNRQIGRALAEMGGPRS